MTLLTRQGGTASGVITDQLRANGRVRRGMIGVQVGDVILSLDGRPVESVRQFSANIFRHAIDATSGQPRRRLDGGILVAAVSGDASTPDRFLPGDVIHAVNRTFVLHLVDLRDAVAGLKDGDPVVVQIER